MTREATAEQTRDYCRRAPHPARLRPVRLSGTLFLLCVLPDDGGSCCWSTLPIKLVGDSACQFLYLLLTLGTTANHSKHGDATNTVEVPPPWLSINCCPRSRQKGPEMRETRQYHRSWSIFSLYIRLLLPCIYL
ncbi:hypothetical protein M440DRAFT_1223578 [Trichoderma longibrachiatum ATCC 18648]|uniref:Uncharacterized protein n=1 Tax=Trichoderma longibrachiatum ATCC 18648 TaxID=983965 RepID=A0A2T4C887_TRILO|nr:hypothetical protein M440DRAFT_1223578 [Trichoderma longibrachiatum ATCC 18648]